MLCVASSNARVFVLKLHTVVDNEMAIRSFHESPYDLRLQPPDLLMRYEHRDRAVAAHDAGEGIRVLGTS
jgi:hypothetical protein